MAAQTASHQFRGLALGTLNGAIYSAVQFIVVSGYYNYLRRLDVADMERRGFSPVQMTEMFNKRLVSIWFLVVFTIVSYLGHRYWSKWEKVPIVFWEAIGVTAIIAWNVVVLTLVWIETKFTGQDWDASLVATSIFGIRSIVLVIITNLIYGGMIGIFDKIAGPRPPVHRVT